MKKKNNKNKLVPKLRFPEFTNDWETEQLSNLLDYERPDNYIVKDTNYTSEGTPVLTANKSFILGYTQESFGICNDIPAIIFDDFTVDKKFVDFPFKVKSSAIKILRPKGKNDLKFLFELMSLIRFEAKEHKRYYISAYQNLTVPIPTPQEQQKIAACLSSLDDLITAESQKLELYQQHKKCLLQNLFPNCLNYDSHRLNDGQDSKNQGNQENHKNQGSDNVPKFRFPEFVDSGEWEVKRLGEVLDYERPDKYIVSSENYNDSGIPVLTANKSFILGYTNETEGVCKNLPAIIFDDFTTDKKYVDFPFKVKSSAIKILRPKGNENLKFIFELMTLIRFEAKEHKRYYISSYQNLLVPIPKPQEQQKIAACLSSLDDLINAQSQKIELLQQHKKGLLQGLFPNLNEVTE